MEHKLLELSKKYGTPLYVYDGDLITQKYNLFKNAFDVKNIKIHFATKALSNITILKLLNKLGAGLDCVSIQEIKIGIKAGFKPNDIIFTPNGVSFNEYKEAIKLGTKITIDNLIMLEKVAIEFPNHPIFIRLNPHIMAGGNAKISVGHIDSKFGISIHQMPQILSVIKKHNINVEGIHVHTGSDITQSNVFNEVAELIFSIADNFDDLKSIDFGGGFKVKYKDDDVYTNIPEIGKAFSKVFNAYCNKKEKDILLRFEPGKFLVSEAGSFLTNVNVVKQTPARTFAAVNSGFNQFGRPMLYNSYHEIVNISNPNGKKKIYNVVGYICESDTFGEDRELNEVKEGDVLLFKNAGAYCASMSSNYNSRFKAAEVLLLDGKEYLIRKHETLETLLLNQIEHNI